MKKNILNHLIIVAGQWKQFGGKQYEQQFENLLVELQVETGLDREGAVNHLMASLGEKKEAA